MAINVFVPRFHTEEILSEIRECLDKGWTGLGFKTIEFENKWKEYSGLPNAHFLNSNTSGLHLAIHLLKQLNNWKDGDEIITTPITFVSTNHAILYERLNPIFSDVDDYLCLDPESVEKRITPRTRAVMFVGIGGNTGQLGRIIEICKKYNLKLILDAAHMSGTKFLGKHVGNESDVAIFSYQAVKNLPSADAGMICFNDNESDRLARQISWLGISKDTYQRFNKSKNSYKWQYDVPNIGYKYHGNSIIASIALVQLKYLDDDNAYRNHLAENYIRLLQNTQNVQIVPVAADCISSRHLFQIIVSERDKVIQAMYDNQIYPGVHYVNNIEYPMYHYAKGTCPRAEYFSNHVLSLPLHLNITENDQQIIIEVLLKAIR